MSHLFESYGVDMGAPHADNALVSLLVERGLAVVDQINPAMLLPLATSIGVVVPHRDSRANGVTTLADLGADVAGSSGFGGFTSSGLDPHTDRAGLARPPEPLLMLCGQTAVSGGECLLVDGQAVHEDLAAYAPEALQALSSPRCALFGGAAGHLGSVFTTSTCGARVAAPHCHRAWADSLGPPTPASCAEAVQGNRRARCPVHRTQQPATHLQSDARLIGDNARGEMMDPNPLSSAALRLECPAQRSTDSGSSSRPFALRFAQQVNRPQRPKYRYCPKLQIALDPQGHPLIETMDKDWLTKRHSDGAEGVEEEYDWEEL